MKLIFFLINMNFGGTEKSFLNLVDTLPEDYEIDLMLIEKKGDLLKDLPERVNLLDTLSDTNISSRLTCSPFENIKSFLRKREFLKAFRGFIYYLKYKLTENHKFIFKIFENEIPEISDRYDIAVAYSGPHSFLTYFVAEKVNSKKKYQWIHFDVTLIPFSVKTNKDLLKNFDEIKVVSKTARDNFVKLLPGLSEKTNVFKNIINIENIKKMATVSGEGFDDSFDGIRILTVGRLTGQKAYNLAVPAVSMLVKQGFRIRYYIIGEGPKRNELIQQIQQLNMENYIFLLGSRENPYPYMAQTDIYLQPSRHEGQGMTIVEAKTFCKPMILTNFTVAKDNITNGVNGLIVEMNSESIFLGIKRVLENDKLRDLLIENLKSENEYENERILPF